MPIMNSESDVMVQYASSDKLNSRIRFHAKYSINKQGFGNWIVGHYRFPSGACMLELGCGTGEMWLGRDELINRCARLVLSDRSEGMLETAKEKLRQYPGIEYEPVDIREIPFPDGSFDVVIANMMLYHVPEIDRALSVLEANTVKGILTVPKEYGLFVCE